MPRPVGGGSARPRPFTPGAAEQRAASRYSLHAVGPMGPVGPVGRGGALSDTFDTLLLARCRSLLARLTGPAAAGRGHYPSVQRTPRKAGSKHVGVHHAKVDGERSRCKGGGEGTGPDFPPKGPWIAI